MRLLLIRHGQTPSNLGHFLDTALPGPGLTDLGVRQASALPRALAGEDIASLYASTLTRTQLTAAPLAAERGIDVRVRDGIRELSAGDLEMRADEDAVRQYLTTAFGWSAGDIARRMPGGENGTEALARFDAVVAEAAGAGERSTVALVSHGAAIRVWTAARARNVTVGFAAEHRLENTGVVVVEGSPASGWTALSWAGTVVPGVTASGAADAGPAGRTLRGPEPEPPAGSPSD
ncbi:histidine phosphatase family protein [Streptomyces sp. NBUL23]|uniref:histidine phosphatase family protein n=1 Tax=Streptomyces TaxID=1883 RepID=UPI001361EF75|nr:histidine phosphatase family protein [Streptomyces sp. SID724]